jgi:hypothetical protein
LGVRGKAGRSVVHKENKRNILAAPSDSQAVLARIAIDQAVRALEKRT